ncbi:unnamed protein product [Moneuplotes crassus]|uniref:Uncharacterized protein n=1 Tax=Euplotes crassus TaxID=5936 RepID=A0AAD1X9J6_EUPCR|nr:unnamed protein product [Moneuplotes crassus]
MKQVSFYFPDSDIQPERKRRPVSSNPHYATKKLIANEEYFRALSLHKKANPQKPRAHSLIESLENQNNDPKILFKIEDKDISLPRKTLYLIDKIIRLRSKKGTLSLQSISDIFQELQHRKGKKLDDYQLRLYNYETLQQSESKKRRPEHFQRGMSYEEWIQHKKLEEEITRIIQDEEKRLLRVKIEQGRLEASKIQPFGEDAHTQWLLNKQQEDEQARIHRRQARMTKKQEEEEKKEAAEQEYQAWLQKIVEKDRQERLIQAERRAKKKQEEEEKKYEKKANKEQIKLALKKWDAWQDMVKAQEERRKTKKQNKIQMLEKALRYKRKNEDEILCYHKNKDKKKSRRIKPDPGPRKTMIYQNTEFYKYEVPNDST